MRKITPDSTIDVLFDLPCEIISEIERVIKILTDSYTTHGIDGGYILMVENERDIENLPMDVSEYEFADRIKTPVGDFLSVLYLTGTEYSITVIIPAEIAPNIIMRGVEE